MQSIELVGRQTTVNPQIAIFITMNPGYAGRSNLPDNLKKLFRSLAMTRPDMQLIAEVTLFSQGYRTAEKLANKIVPFFRWVDRVERGPTLDGRVGMGMPFCMAFGEVILFDMT